jgi:hypothetical protein
VKPACAPVAVVVSDLTSLAVLGLTARQFKAFLRERQVPHFRQGRRTLARVDRVLEALDRLAGAQPLPEWNEASVIELAARGGRR